MSLLPITNETKSNRFGRIMKVREREHQSREKHRPQYNAER